MKQFHSLRKWLVSQFKAHPLRSSLIVSGISLLLILGCLLVFGVFESEGLNLDQSGFDYLPEREYILGAKEDERPRTLNELLYSQNADIEDFLHSPDIAAELLAAENLMDIVDSRYALDNLRNIERQLNERTEEENLPMGDLVTLNSTPVEPPVIEKPPSPADALKPFMPDPAPVEEKNPLPKSEGAKRLDEMAEAIVLNRPAEVAQVRDSYNLQQDIFGQLRDKVADLLEDAEYGEWERLPSSINLKGIWQNPGEALVHMVPEADWLPEEGYRIYRQIGDTKELVVEQLAATQKVFTNHFKHPDAQDIQQIYKAAEYSENDRATLGMDEATFHDTIYRTRPMLREVVHMGGEKDFLLMKEAQITIPDGVDQKMPQSDRALSSPVQIMNLPENGRYEAGSIRSQVWKRFSVYQAELPYGIQSFGDPSTGGENKAYEAAATTLEARQQISTLAFVDDDFAEEAGFLIRDDLSGMKLPNGECITYTIESPHGQSASVKLYWGEELPLTKPEGFMGYGLDGKVYLRWRKPASETEGKIISGYFIERKLEGESKFVVVHDKPVVITEILDKTGVFFETPVMYQEKLENGTKAQYRLYSIDIFGRRSECCEPINIRVEKVTPPDSPTTSSLILLGGEEPFLSDDVLGNAIREAIAKNKGKDGIVIPIFNESPDTVRFTLYRAEAIGAGSYGKPVPLANFRFDNPKKGMEGKEGTLPEVPSETTKNKSSQSGKTHGQYAWGKLFDAHHLFLKNNEPLAPDMIYFDADIEKGVTYKYWVSAWDSWNNESAWSKSCAIGVPTSEEPSVPDSLMISMMTRKLPDYSRLLPGIVADENVSQKNLEEDSDRPTRLSAENTSVTEMADISGVRIGSYISGEEAPLILSRLFDNFPEQKYIHIFLGVRGKDVLPDGSARLRWPAYSGDDLGGYVVYQLHGEPSIPEDVQNLDRDELMALGQWTKLTDKALEQNQYLVQGLDPERKGVHLFLVCLEPSHVSTDGDAGDGTGELTLLSLARFTGALPINQNPEGGYVLLEWEEPKDLQVKHYRIYRSEVQNFKKAVDESTLEWTLVGDLISGTQFTDPVEQSHAHYYYYKITAVSPWGVESSIGTVEKFRVPSTKPPQTPNLLLPLSRKDGVQVNFSSVEYCSRYEVYRAEIPKITADKLKDIDSSVLRSIFTTPAVNDDFLTSILKKGVDSAAKGAGQKLNALLSFKTVTLSQAERLSAILSQVDVSQRQSAYSEIIHKFGPLALADYGELSLPMMELVEWTKIAEIPVDEDTEELVDPGTGLKKPLSVIDYDAQYGTHYLYTVQAWNDDELGSTRPEPVEATPRRNRGFDPIDGLSFTISHGEFPSIDLTWNEPRMAGLTPDQCLEDTIGYIVYYSTEKDGVYVQASPLQFDPSWRDAKADRAATNWYKVRVLDTGGYLSDFSEPILARENVTIELPKTDIPGESESSFYRMSTSAESHSPQIMRLATSATGKVELSNTLTWKFGDFSGFPLRNITLESPTFFGARFGLKGSAELLFGEPGVGQVLPVRIADADYVVAGKEIIFTEGVLYVDKPYKLEEIGVTISSLNIPFNSSGKVSGFVQNSDPSKNLLGNLSGFAFTDALLRGQTDIYIGLKQGQMSVLPEIRIDRLTLDRISSVVISLDTNKNSTKVLSFITEATLKAPLETLNNEGIRMLARDLCCDAHGRISGSLETMGITPQDADRQFLQLLVPGGAGLKVEARIVYEKGVPIDDGFIEGKVILPFERAKEMGTGSLQHFARVHSAINTMDYFMDPAYDKEKHDDSTTNEYFINFGEIAQQNGLLIVPADPDMQKDCAFAEFSVNNWNGEGFMVESANLTPVRVADRSLSKDLQRAQAIIVSPTEISIDLDRNAYLPATKGSETPRETEKPFWVGMVFKGGELALPPAFVQTDDGQPIKFRLAEGEMIYDLNGFNYQTYLYNDEGVPAAFGEQLGGFSDVIVYDCLLDMYANKVNLEINAEVALELFNNNRVKVKLYTNKEDNEDAKGGEFLCSVAPTVIEDFVGPGTKLTIDGGFLKPEGMRFGGAIELTTPEIQLKEPMKFTTMVVPAKKTDTFADNNADKLHAWATLDKSAPIHMQGFSMDIREINFEYLAANVTPGTATRLSLWGSVLLSEEIALGAETTDRISVDTLKGSTPEMPEVIYKNSHSLLETSFDGCIDVKGVLVPKRLASSSSQVSQPQSLTPTAMAAHHPIRLSLDEQDIKEAEKAVSQIEQGLVEFQTENLDLGFLGSLGELPIDTITRFGYDVDNARCYFSIGMLKKAGDKELNVGIGSLDKFSGLIVNNMIVERDEQKHLVFPEGKAEMKEFISEMEVDRSQDGKMLAAMKGTLNIKKIAQVRDLYFGFESGPLVEASGGLYLPLDVDVILNPQSDGFRHVGDVDILYSHPDRYFSFSMTLNEIDMVAIKLSGSLGFEFSPKLFGVYVGYPETLAGNIGIYRVGLGLGFRLDDDGANIIKAKIEFGFERSVDVSIVYLRGFIYAGADGAYYEKYDQDGDGEYDGSKFILTIYLKGGLEGGIKVSGKRYNIINMYLDARGTIESIPKKDEWKLTCSAKVSYSLNLYLFSVSGSVSAKFDTTL